MAFRDTSDRYKYIYGSNVRKLEESGGDISGRHQSNAAPEKKDSGQSVSRTVAQPEKKKSPKSEAQIQKNRARLLEFDWRYTVMSVIAVILCACGALLYVHGTVKLNVLTNQISSLKSDKASLESKQSALEAEIDKAINLDEIRTYAQEKLHMTYPDQNHILYYTDDSSDYFRQYESVDASK